MEATNALEAQGCRLRMTRPVGPQVSADHNTLLEGRDTELNRSLEQGVCRAGESPQIPHTRSTEGGKEMSFMLVLLAPRDGLEPPTGWLTVGSVEEGS